MTTPTLRQYLDSRQTKGGDWNLTGMGTGTNGWTGKYAVPEEEYEKFLMLAHTHIFEKGRACSLLEKHRAQSPILIDLDFRYTSGGPLRRRFTDEQIREFVAACADTFSHFFEPPADAGLLQFFVMVKPAPEADAAHDLHKDGVHIVCPSITTTPEIQYALRGHLLQKGVIEQIFGDTGMMNPPQDCFDLSVIQRNNWFLYGACKPDKAWYKVTQVYTYSVPSTTETVTSDMLESQAIDTWSSLDLMKLLSIRANHEHATELTLRNTAESQWKQLLQRWGKGSNWAKSKSPGVGPKPTVTFPPSLNLDTIQHVGGADTDSSRADEMVQVSGISVRSGYSTEDVALAYRLTRECLNPVRRVKQYHDWVNTGLLLHNICSKEESFNVWVELSRRVPGCANTPDSIYKEKWAALPAEAAALQRGRKPLLMGTLHLWAKEDSEASYKAIMSESNKEMAMLNDSGTHVSVAELVVKMYRHEFRCTPPRKGASAAAMDWYQFPYDSHTWRSLKTAMRVRERLSNEVRNMYIQANREVMDRSTKATEQDERDRLDKKSKDLFKVANTLYNSGFKDSVMKEVTEKFYDEEFLQHMNQDPATLGFANGVLELRHMETDGKPHIFFRPGRPDDCISFQMGRGMAGLEAIPYIPYDPVRPTPDHVELMEFFTKIYPDPVLREYALTLFSSCLEGANREQKFYIMTGAGSNGKSKIVELMSTTFGEYQETLSTTALTRKRPESGAANPDLVVLKCKRFVSMSEPDEGEKINTSSMKQLSGEDTVKARALFQDQDQFVIMAKIFMLCNDLPPVTSIDNGTWRRLRVIPHVACFVDGDKPTDPANHIHHKDLLLDGKIRRWRPAFASLLAWYYENRYLRDGLKEPAQVMSASLKYKEENDAFGAFCSECLVREVGAELRANDACIRYKEWTKFNPGKKMLTKPMCLQKLSEVYGQPIEAAGKVYVGVRLKLEEEDS